MIDVTLYALLKNYVDKATSGASSMIPCGQWNIELAYAKGSIVSNSNKLYMAIKDVPINTPLTEVSFWSLLLENNSESDKTYKFQQVEVANEWNIVHNLNKYPSVSIVDSLGNMISGDVQYIDLNEVKIALAKPYNGWVYLN